MRIFPKAKILSQDLPRRLYEGSPAFLCRTQLQGHPGWDPHSHGRFPYGTGASSMGSMGILGEWFTNQKYLWWWTNPNYRHINPISQRSTQLGNQSNSLTSIMNPSKPSYTSTYLVLWGGRYFTVSEQICGAHVFFSANFSLVSPILSRSAVQSFYDPSFDVVCIGANCKPGTLLEYVFCIALTWK